MVRSKFPGVAGPLCTAGIISILGSVAVSLCVFPPLIRGEGVLGSIMNADKTPF